MSRHVLYTEPMAPAFTAALAQRAQLLACLGRDACSLPRMAHPLRLPPTTPGRLRAVDLARAPDGEWRVIRDHADSPLLEAPVLATFLPALCRALLGQSLQLPSMPVWWLGDPATLALLRADPRRYRLRPSLDAAAPPIGLADLCAADRCRLQETVLATPHEYVAGLDLSLPTCRVHLV